MNTFTYHITFPAEAMERYPKNRTETTCDADKHMDGLLDAFDRIEVGAKYAHPGPKPYGTGGGWYSLEVILDEYKPLDIQVVNIAGVRDRFIKRVTRLHGKPVVLKITEPLNT